MTDIEKVIKGLEGTEIMLKQAVDRGGEMAVMGAFKCYNHVSDALAMLKEQEAKTVESIQMDRSNKWGADLTGYCPSCKRPLKLRFNQRFCGECGQEVKWE